MVVILRLWELSLVKLKKKEKEEEEEKKLV